MSEMILDLGEEAREYGLQALRAFESAGGDQLVQRAEADRTTRDALRRRAGGPRCVGLEPRDDADSLRRRGAVPQRRLPGAPLPVAERLSRSTELDADG
jgi:hypothetical protein